MVAGSVLVSVLGVGEVRVRVLHRGLAGDPRPMGVLVLAVLADVEPQMTGGMETSYARLEGGALQAA